MDNSSEDRHKEKFKRYLEAEVTKLFTGVLDYAEVAVDNKERWKVLRARILKLSNDTIREMKKELDTKYTIAYTPVLSDEIIVVNKRK